MIMLIIHRLSRTAQYLCNLVLPSGYANRCRPRGDEPGAATRNTQHATKDQTQHTTSRRYSTKKWDYRSSETVGSRRSTRTRGGERWCSEGYCEPWHCDSVSLWVCVQYSYLSVCVHEREREREEDMTKTLGWSEIRELWRLEGWRVESSGERGVKKVRSIVPLWFMWWSSSRTALYCNTVQELLKV